MLQLTLASWLLLILAPPPSLAPSAGSPPIRWTSPGWYLLEEKQDGSPDLIRAGPLRDQDHCTSVREDDYPPGPAGHPELDTLRCRELLKNPD
jgi:hypothetical protein